MGTNGHDQAQTKADRSKILRHAVAIASFPERLFYRFHIAYRQRRNKASTALLRVTGRGQSIPATKSCNLQHVPLALSQGRPFNRSQLKWH
ncbi:MAG TPA: hypothetical protein DD666_11790 [Advenella kashmirensis]|uniref:Uncharacterized protein n=1 Tax=Advenella kashmirensis TaxID=310575 RepID=A0A356LHU6_9BURK|nr:hypothetical protein [Advenella kashmirensis]